MKREALVFRDATKVAARELITCGFELETQSTEGLGWSAIENGDGDLEVPESVKQRILDSLVDDPGYFVNHWLVSERPENFKSLDYWTTIDNLRGMGLRRTAHLLEKRIITAEIRDKVRGRLEKWMKDNYSFSFNPREYMNDNFRIPERVQVGEDGSVDGFEFRTVGGLTYAQFRQAANGIFKLRHEIDSGCSFHIHLAVKGVQHRYGQRLQEAMVEYLAEHPEQVPASVRERWEGVRENEYISNLVSNEGKYNFINKHDRYNTWEFRCFGNVKSSADAVKCLHLAIAALQHGYKVITGEAACISAPYDLDSDSWDDAVYRALETGTKLSSILRRNAEQAA